MQDRTIRAVVFDFDSTLAETHIDFAEMHRRIVRHLKDWGLWEGAWAGRRFVLELIDLGAAKLAAQPERQRQFLDEAERHLQAVEVAGYEGAALFPGVFEALRKLRERGFKVGIITRNCRECVTALIEEAALPHDVLLTRADVARVKPDPLHLTAALEAMGVAPGDALMVGDHPTDIECGLAAGAMTAGVLTGNTTREQFAASGAEMVFEGVADVVEWVLGAGCLTPPAPLSFAGSGGGGSTAEPAALPVGKLDMPLLAALLGDIASADPSVLVGPGIGCDVAVLDIGGEFDLLAKSDPITFATDAIGHYAVAVNGNDIATAGGTPKWFLATLLLPETATTEEVVAGIFRQLMDACEASGISLVGGHTEVTAGLDRPIICGHMLGTVLHGKALTSGGVQPGDAILLTKGIAVEGTAILAREKHAELLAAGFEEEWLREAQGLLFAPGISVLREARAAVQAAEVHAMHDPTEGGLATALWEMAVAAGVSIVVDDAAIPVLPQCRRLCDHLGLEPLGLIASGALLIATPEAGKVIAACAAEGIACAQIGTAQAGEARVVNAATGAPLPRYDQDEIAKVL